MHPRDLYPKQMLDEMRRLAALPYEWGEIVQLEFPKFECIYKVDTWLRRINLGASDFSGNIAGVAWLKQGPKVAKVTEQQYTALSKVDVNLELHELTLPYPTVLVVMPPKKLHKCCLVHRYSADILICVCISHDNKDDVTTIVRHRDGVFVEESLEKYDETCADITKETCCTLRVAVNMLLALTNFGHQSELLFPKEVRDDESIIHKKGGEAAGRAIERLKISPMLVRFDREVVLHRDRRSELSEPTGRKVCFHWVRGHWKSQPYGEKNTLRKRIYIAPYMVNADSLIADPMDTTTTYRTRKNDAKDTAKEGTTSTNTNCSTNTRTDCDATTTNA